MSSVATTLGAQPTFAELQVVFTHGSDVPATDVVDGPDSVPSILLQVGGRFLTGLWAPGVAAPSGRGGGGAFCLRCAELGGGVRPGRAHL